MKTLIIILSSLSTIALANTDSDKNKFISGLAQRYTALLCGTEYLACINKNKSECVNSVMTATFSCPIESFYKTTNPENKDDELQIKEIKREGYLFGNCVSDAFIKNINISKKTSKKCESSLLIQKHAK